MRITIVTGPLLPVPALRGGSVPRMWHGLAEQFAARGHDVLVIARSFPGQPRNEVRGGVRYERVGGFAQTRSTWLNLAKDFIYATQIVRHLPPADILVINDFWLPILAGFLSRTSGLIVVSANRFPKGQYGLYRRVSRVIAASSVVQRAIVTQTPAMNGRVRCIPNPFDTEAFVPPGAGRKDRTHKKLLYTGRVHPEKGVHVLINTFRQITCNYPGLTLQILGPVAPDQGGGGEDYLRNLQRLAEGLPVTFSPPEFDVVKLAAVYQSADLFCYPSLAEKGEALGVAPLEAMSTGLPVIVSSLECFDDFLSEGENGLRFDHRTENPIAALSGKLEEALQNWSRTLQLGVNARRSAERYSFDRVADEFLADFKLLLSEQGARSEERRVNSEKLKN